jgi:TonB family protein
MMKTLKYLVWLAVLIVSLVSISRPVMAQEKLDEDRKTTKRVAPVYPPLARQAHLSGTVKMVVVVTPEGTVTAVRTIGGNPVLVSAAEDAVKQWKFEVAKKESSVLVAISFGEAH